MLKETEVKTISDLLNPYSGRFATELGINLRTGPQARQHGFWQLSYMAKEIPANLPPRRTGFS